MKAIIYLNEENHNPINLDGNLIEFMQGSKGSTIKVSGGENNKKLGTLFTEIREGESKKEMKGLIEGAICIRNEEEGTETLYFPAPVRVHVK